MFKKLRKVTVIALALTMAMSFASFAKGWVRSDSGKWIYMVDNDHYAVNEWIGNYYVGADGGLLTNAWTPDGKYVGSDGQWTGQVYGQTATTYDYYTLCYLVDCYYAEAYGLYGNASGVDTSQPGVYNITLYDYYGNPLATLSANSQGYAYDPVLNTSVYLPTYF